MSGNYFGEPNLRKEKGSVSGSSRKGKKSNTDKPKQSQRGLGVAQLEKMRFQGQMASASYYPYFHPPYSNLSNLNQEGERMLPTDYSLVQPSSFSCSSSASYGFHPNIMMGIGEYEKTNITYGDGEVQPSTVTSWKNSENRFLEAPHFADPSATTTHLLSLQVEDDLLAKKNGKKQRRNSSSQNSESSDSQELDLELRLSI